MPEARIAPVRPRVVSEASGETLLLEEEVRRYLDEGAKGAIALIGPPGSGKTTALGHLAAVLPTRAVFLDGSHAGDSPEATGASFACINAPNAHDVTELARNSLTIYAATEPLHVRHLAQFQLAHWDRDDFIDYLLFEHKDRCASVMARLRRNEQILPEGNPELCRIALDELAADHTLAGFRACLLRYLERNVGDAVQLASAAETCLDAFARSGKPPPLTSAYFDSPSYPNVLLRLLRHGPVQILLAARRLASDLKNQASCAYLDRRLPRSLIDEAAEMIGDDPLPRQQLANMFARRANQPMAASLMLAVEPTWTPPDNVASLEGAYLANARWLCAQLACVTLRGVDLAKADLREANLGRCDAFKSYFGGANLAGAGLEAICARYAIFSYADLSKVRAQYADFRFASFVGATLADAVLAEAKLEGAQLTNACFVGAHLHHVDLRSTAIEGADFTDADLTEANLEGLRLCDAEFTQACFALAQLKSCNLEDMHLPRANFKKAKLHGALLTGTRMPCANLHGADLRNSGLADIDWPGADLRNADLTGASFHLGSSRSGLVGSPIASEGSRTGFYTDDYEEQHYKAPEQIRKANLREADLRGARIEGVDFYLVDLRGAKLDDTQVDHLRHCRAILR